MSTEALVIKLNPTFQASLEELQTAGVSIEADQFYARIKTLLDDEDGSKRTMRLLSIPRAIAEVTAGLMAQKKQCDENEGGGSQASSLTRIQSPQGRRTSNKYLGE